MIFHARNRVAQFLLALVLAALLIRLILVLNCFVKAPKLERGDVSEDDAARVVDALANEFPHTAGPVKFSFVGLGKAFFGIEKYSIVIRIQRHENYFTANIDRSNDSYDRSDTVYSLNPSYEIVERQSLKLAPRGWQER